VLHHLIEYIYVEGQPFHGVQVLEELAADGAADPGTVVELGETLRAECVAAVDEDAGDALAHVVLEAAEVAEVELALLVVHSCCLNLNYSWPRFIYPLIIKLKRMNVQRNDLRDNFLRQLSNYSICITPYLRNIQDKYATQLYLVEDEGVDPAAYCKNEFDQVVEARKKLEQGGASA